MIDMISLHPQELGATTVRQNCIKNGLQIPVDHCYAERAIEPNTLYAPLYNARRLILNAESSRKYYLIIAGNGVTLG